MVAWYRYGDWYHTTYIVWGDDSSDMRMLEHLAVFAREAAKTVRGGPTIIFLTLKGSTKCERRPRIRLFHAKYESCLSRP